MAGSSSGRASFLTQANALLRKNIIFQKRNASTNIRLILVPVIFFAIFGFAQRKLDEAIKGVRTPAITKPPKFPPLLQVPPPQYRAVRTDSLPFVDLPNELCIKDGSCPVTVLLTGKNQSLGESVAGNLFPSSSKSNYSDTFSSLANDVFGSDSDPTVIKDVRYTSDQAFFPSYPAYIYQLQPKCTRNSTASTLKASMALKRDVACVEALPLWRNSSSQINDELFKGYQKGNPKGKTNEIMTAYDFLNSDANNFNVSIWYNSTYKGDEGEAKAFPTLRVPRSINMASNAYLQSFLGPASKVLFEFVKEMPKPESVTKIDLFVQLGSLFFTWIILQLFPVILTSLVYEKQQKLRIIMKMHGLGDGPYWLISYAYFLALSSIYMSSFMTCGTILGFKYFTLNDYGIQMVFYFSYVNVQISFAFLVAAIFASVKTAAVVSYILVFATGLVGFYFESCVEDPSFPRDWIIAMELYPGFALYRGLYEFRQYSSVANMMGTVGMQWKDLSDSVNGMREVLIIMGVEWLVFLFVAYYIDQVVSAGGGVRRSPLFFLQSFRKKPESPLGTPSFHGQGPHVSIERDKDDVAQEREKVEQLVREPSTNYAVISDNLKKVYPGRDGNPEKFAVKGLSLALPRGECFGMLGPNGAGKTSFISMMIGLTEPSSGAAYVQGLDIRTQMDEIYTSMGVCPQQDLLWETLTAREHLLFYGRLKNLSGAALTQAVEESLKGVNLLRGGVADKPAGKYSGGMKRRLSVAISLIGDPKVVYMDEPSTGLDPASRNMLWNVVTRAKEGRAIILTTHSMEEAEHLCDRLGIFVDGSLQCIGRTNELKGRYGGSYVLTMTTSPDYEADVEDLVRHLCPNAVRTYHIPGTQKFELPKKEVNIAYVFQAVEDAKKRFTVQAWGLADTTLEDVFVKVARNAEAFNVLS